MKRSSKSRSGSNTGALFVIGLLSLLVLFLGGRSTSARDAILKVLRNAGYSDRMANWWVAVSNFETAKWTSELYKRYHNLFGMSQPMQRNTLSLGGVTLNGRTWASFSNDTQSVEDLVLYMKNFSYPKDFDNIESMVSFMKGVGYFEESLNVYLAGVKSRL